jgi:hypothetical protein
VYQVQPDGTNQTVSFLASVGNSSMQSLSAIKRCEYGTALEAHALSSCCQGLTPYSILSVVVMFIYCVHCKENRDQLMSVPDMNLIA